ncbi:transposase [Verrucomicrobiota bacterium]
MTRPLRIDVENGWYHVTARGIERRVIFCDERHGEHFLELLDELSDRFSIRVHAYVLMMNHYHLILQSPYANVSAAMQWLNVSYSAWFNAKHSRVGHVFQGRFGSKLIDGDGSWLLQASVYLHLNPVRVAALDMGKQNARAEALGLKKPSAEEVKKRLKVLREHKWSSYSVYTGVVKKPDWLQTSSILARAGGKVKYRKYVESHVTHGTDPDEYNTVKERLLIGGHKFVEEMKQRIGAVSQEHPERTILAKRIPLSVIVEIVEGVKGESWKEFGGERGGWGKPLVLYLARKRSGLTLQELGDWLGGVSYKTVSKVVERFTIKIKSDRKILSVVNECIEQMSNVET